MTAAVLTIARISPAMAAVCNAFGCTPGELVGADRHAALALPRHVLMWLGVRHYRLSLPVIARALGGRHHTTVLHARRRIDAMLEVDEQLRRIVYGIQSRLDRAPAEGAL